MLNIECTDVVPTQSQENGIREARLCQSLNICRKGRAEQQCLMRIGQVALNLIDLRQEAHAEHFVALVEEAYAFAAGAARSTL